jgi:excisionase family DNA binding protein
MKIELETYDIEKIVQGVIEQITPLLSHDSKNNAKEMMTTEELSVYLNTKEQSIYDKVHAKSIPFLKYGNSLRFRKNHIDMWLINPYHPDLDNYNLRHSERG